MKRKRYFNKVPHSTFRPDARHWTRKNGGAWKEKVAYESEDDAWEFLNQSPGLRARGYRAYECAVCGKWHVGRLRHKVDMTEKEFVSVFWTGERGH